MKIDRRWLLAWVLVVLCAPTWVADELPGVELPVELATKLAQGWKSQGKSYVPRTRHVDEDGKPLFTNRLILQSSPYLIQHAHNPVNWYPWGDEAFETALKLGRPVLLSIGYSTCHWCHVMEEESFEDLEIARYLNANYVAIKVDREERPDLDSIYMNAVQLLTGRGGWPMTTWLTPDRKVFFGGTYFPARDGDRGARKGFLSVLGELNTVYISQPDKVEAQAEQLVKKIQLNLETGIQAAEANAAMIDEAVKFYTSRYDPVNGGLRGAPKFPSSLPVRLLLRRGVATGEGSVREMALHTLRSMANGGIYDQVGGGFHRYSVNAEWGVPHFEKMLYDNALLVPAYVEAWQVTGDAEFARVVDEVLTWLGREMTAPGGGFYSATDADSLTQSGEREEGYFFTWTPAELRKALTADQAKAFESFYSISDAGNFEGRNIPQIAQPLGVVADRMGLSRETLQTTLAAARKRLLEVRSKRPAPLRDDKIVAAWNGLTISAFARAGFAFDRPDWVESAETAASFVLSTMVIDGRLKRSFAGGRAGLNAYLDDHAFLVAGLLDLFETTSDLRWLREAKKLQDFQDRYFLDERNGGYYMTGADHEKLLAREKPLYDGAEPSGNSIAAMNLLRLNAWTGEPHYGEKSDKVMQFLGGRLDRSASSMAQALLALDFRERSKQEIVLVQAPGGEASSTAFLKNLRKRFAPQRVLYRVEGLEAKQPEAISIPWLAGKTAIEGKTTAYVCRDQVCRLPTVDPNTLREILDEWDSTDPKSQSVISPRKK